MIDLKGKVALVTGGASGIGHAFVKGLVAAGSAVAIADLSGEEDALAKLRAEGHDVIGVRCDVADENAIAASVSTVIETMGGISVLVNNAAYFSALKPGSFIGISAPEWERVMRVNTLGPFLMARATVPEMRRAGYGRIINIASNTVHKGAPGLLHYVSSKGAVIAMTRALSREIGTDGITVNAIASGFTLSEGVMSNESYQSTFRSAAADARAISRDQTPADLVGALLFLASDLSGFVTGQTLVVDGGNVFP